MHNMLKQIIAAKEIEVAQLATQSVDIVTAAKLHKPKDFKKMLSNPGLSFICEIKRKSPSKGVLSSIVNLAELLGDYVEGGTDAVSVLTDSEFFGGSIDDCMQVSEYLAATNICVLRKDFIISEIQILQALASGADAILLIAAVLGSDMNRLLKFAKKHGIAAIVEVHTVAELQAALTIGAEIIGINNRNLDTFATDINNCLELISLVPDYIITIAESAIYSAADIKKITAAGFDAVLIGEALVTAASPKNKLIELKMAAADEA